MAVAEILMHRGEQWRRIAAEPMHDRFIVGLDLGQSNDPTAVCVIHHHRKVCDTWTTVKLPAGGGTIRQDVAEHFDVRHLARLPLGMSYPVIVTEVADILARPPLRGDAELVVDQTGCGAPVADLLAQGGLRPLRITITAGNEPQQHGARSWAVPKHVLISTLDARLHTGELRFAAEITEAGAMAEELKDFRRKVSAAGRYSYEARVGKHDDLVLACAIALWVACRPQQQIIVAPVLGSF